MSWRRQDGSAAPQTAQRPRTKSCGGAGHSAAQPGSRLERRGRNLQSRRPGWCAPHLAPAANPTAPRAACQRRHGPEAFGKIAPREGTASRPFPVIRAGWIWVSRCQIFMSANPKLIVTKLREVRNAPPNFHCRIPEIILFIFEKIIFHFRNKIILFLKMIF